MGISVSHDQTEGNTGLNKVFVQIRRTLVEPLMEFNFQRFVLRKGGGDLLVRPADDFDAIPEGFEGYL